MATSESIPNMRTEIRDLEKKISALKLELKEVQATLTEETTKLDFYKLIADYAFSWELWINPAGKINYCSPSCFDLTGYTSNQIIAADRLSELLVYQADQYKFDEFVTRSLKQAQMNQSLDFRIRSRSKQLRWCMMNIRGVYDRNGKYLGIRASVQDITRLKRAMGQIQEMDALKELEDRSRLRLQSQLNEKDRELVSFLLQLSAKNELISTVIQNLNTFEINNPEKCQKQHAQLLKLLNQNISIPIDWPIIESQLDTLHPGYLNRLQIKYPTISLKDKKICAYIRLGLSSKNISGLQNITIKSVEIARIRLRKKLKLSGKIRLTNFLAQI
jgi:PAS domain S-box-containing protein